MSATVGWNVEDALMRGSMTSMSERDARMRELMSQLPQNRGMDWDAVMPVIEFTFSTHPDPSKSKKTEYRQSDEDATTS